jgi:hypothetical protein
MGFTTQASAHRVEWDQCSWCHGVQGQERTLTDSGGANVEHCA